MNDKIALYHNCIKVHEVNVTKEPRELVFESASTFYLAQAGSIIKGKFEVSFKNNKTFIFCHCSGTEKDFLFDIQRERDFFSGEINKKK
jgi:hypothetical protein